VEGEHKNHQVLRESAKGNFILAATDNIIVPRLFTWDDENLSSIVSFFFSAKKTSP
jgi:hypothetical protein